MMSILRNGTYKDVITQLQEAGFIFKATYWENQLAATLESRAQEFNNVSGPGPNQRQIWLNPRNGLIAELHPYFERTEIAIHGAIALNEHGQENLYNNNNAFQDTSQALMRTQKIYREATTKDIEASGFANFAGSFENKFDFWEGASTGFKGLDRNELYAQTGLTDFSYFKSRVNYTRDGQPALTFSVPVDAFYNRTKMGQEGYKHGIDLEIFSNFISQYGRLAKRNELQDPQVVAFLGHQPLRVHHLVDQEAHEIMARCRYETLPADFKNELGPIPSLSDDKPEYRLDAYRRWLQDSRLQNTLNGLTL